MKRLPLITSLVICVGAIAMIAVNVRSCRRARSAPEPEPLSAVEITRARIVERMSDPSYTNGLAVLADKQAELVRLRSEAAREFEVWCEVFLASNAQARAIFDQIQALMGEGMSRTNAAVADKAAEFEALVAADPQGRRLLDKRDMIAEALAEHGRISRAFIGARVRRQSIEQADEERKAAERYRRQLVAEGKVAPPPPKPAMTNVVSAPRGEGWWTNQPARPARVPSASSSGDLNAEDGK